MSRLFHSFQANQLGGAKIKIFEGNHLDILKQTMAFPHEPLWVQLWVLKRLDISASNHSATVAAH